MVPGGSFKTDSFVEDLMSGGSVWDAESVRVAVWRCGRKVGGNKIAELSLSGGGEGNTVRSEREQWLGGMLWRL